MKTLLTVSLAALLLAWGVSYTPAEGAHLAWMFRQESLNLSGFLAIAMMSLAMLLAIRPAWLEKSLGGMDRIYRAHKWVGIFAAIFAFWHWFSKEVWGDILKSTIGKEGRVPKDHFVGIWGQLQEIGKDIAEVFFYAFLVMVALALLKKVPYRFWRYLHKSMPVIYLALVFHSLMFVPLYYWSKPLGWLIVAFIGVGLYASCVALLGQIGRGKKFIGQIEELETISPNILRVQVKVNKNFKYQAGQFVFVTFDGLEGGHPFTIASYRSDNKLEFLIKSLGDYTAKLASTIQRGQEVKIEGPYGEFKLPIRSSDEKQIWLAAGVGITPFIAWLEALRVDPKNCPNVQLHYACADKTNDPLVAKLEELCAELTHIELKIYSAADGETMNPVRSKNNVPVWFCGPKGLREKMQTKLGKQYFYYEFFEMR